MEWKVERREGLRFIKEMESDGKEKKIKEERRKEKRT
jgi:hypothetical protein